jgi:ABC-2 type transport system permease protein
MTSSIFLKTLWEKRRSLVGWAIGLAAFVLLNMAFYPSVRDNDAFSQMAEEMPEFLRALFGEDFVSPVGYLDSQMFALMIPLLLLIYAANRGADAIAGEEDRGTLDLLMSTPRSRTRVVVEKALALIVSTALLALVIFVCVAGTLGLVSLDIAVANVAAATAGSLIVALLLGIGSLALGAATGQKSSGHALVAVLGVGGYLIDSLSQIASALEPFRWVSPFYYYRSGIPLKNGFDTGYMVILLGATLVLLAVGIYGFNRRDTRS